ncbi:M24 family metallopeptidase, partial [Candidatus Pelagibacter sp.]|nr:M24 family metallopeptidase [Candidatus Pelagibacter sp.]
KFLKVDKKEIIKSLLDSNLTGRGGAGFPTGMKWDFCSKAKGDKKYVICNADEGDSGAFSDRYLLEDQPLKVIFGMVICGLVIGGDEGVLYIRGEYPKSIEAINGCINELKKLNLLGENILGTDFSFDLGICIGQGAYICGEETALIASIEGRRAEVDVRPPFPVTEGLYKKPTVVNNVETLAAATGILINGAEKFSSIGNKKSAGRDRMEREIVKTYPDAEYMDTWVWFQSGINTDGAHNPKTNRKLAKGDILSLNTFPMISGYYTALERTLFLDHADDESLKAWEANVKVHKRGLELIKPGVKCSDICHELNELFAELGYLHYRTFGYGHSFGVLSHFYGREAGLELREDIDTVLEENMVVSMEPMIMIPEGNPGAGGYREHDILVIGKDGAENITKFPFGPEHNIIQN